MIGFWDFLHYVVLIGTFVLAFYCVWGPLMWIAHDLWLDRYRAKQVMLAEYRDGGYSRIEEELQQEINTLCEHRLGLHTKVAFRVMNSTIGLAFSIGNDVWLPPSPQPSTSSSAGVPPDQSSSSSITSSLVSQSIEVTDLISEDDDVDDRTGLLDSHTSMPASPTTTTSPQDASCKVLYDQFHSWLTRWVVTSIAWALRHVVVTTYQVDQYIQQRFPNHPLISLSTPYQSVIGISPIVYSVDRHVSMWLLKRRLYFVKYNTAMSRGVIMTLQFIIVVFVLNGNHLMKAFSFRWLELRGLMSLLMMFASFPLTQIVLDRFHHLRADRFANRISSIEELKGAIRFIDAESRRNDICKFVCAFIFAGVLWPGSRSNALIRIANIQLLLKKRQQTVSITEEGDRSDVDLNQFMQTAQYGEQLHRMTGMLDQSIMSVVEERKVVGNIFSSPLDALFSNEIHFRGVNQPQLSVDRGNEQTNTTTTARSS